MEGIFNYNKNPDDDFYNIVGCCECSSAEQILTEYKIRALNLHPDKNPDDQKAHEEFKKLQNAKEFLCDPVKRKLYDKWKCGSFAMPFEQWLNLCRKSHSSMHWATPKTKDPMLLPGDCEVEGVSETENNCVPENHGNEAALHRKPQHWVPEPGNEMLRKFRNYEI